MSEEKKITMVGLRQAKKDFLFLHEEPLKECGDCRLYKVCMTNLEPGRVYKIIEVRDNAFPCNIHEDGVRVVVVVEAKQKIAVDAKYVFPQAIITYKPRECVKLDCPSYSVCVPQGIKQGDKVKILEVIDPIRCPLEHSLVAVRLHRLAQE